jgi:hypothetical protein
LDAEHYCGRRPDEGETERGIPSLFPFINVINREVAASFHGGIFHATIPKGPAVEKNHVEIHYGGGEVLRRG